MDRGEFERDDAYAVRDLATAPVLSDQQWRALIVRLTTMSTTED
jgi:hypothetical protein